VLIVGLWALFLLSSLAVAVRAHVAGQLELARRISGRTRSYYIARAGVEQAVALLRADSNGWDAVTEPWGNNPALFDRIPCGAGVFSLTYVTERAGGGMVTNFGLEDECGRIDINEVGAELLQSVFEVAGELDPDSAGKLAEAISISRIPETERTGHGPPRAGLRLHAGPFDSIYELLLLEGMDRKVFERVRRCVTVAGSFRVNINTASEPVLLSVAQRAAGKGSQAACRGLVQRILRYREAGNAFTDQLGAQVEASLAGFGALTEGERQLLGRMAPMLTVRSDRFRGTARGVVSGDQTLSREIVFVWDRNNRNIRFWHED
jgi:hypothetical protein